MHSTQFHNSHRAAISMDFSWTWKENRKKTSDEFTWNQNHTCLHFSDGCQISEFFVCKDFHFLSIIFWTIEPIEKSDLCLKSKWDVTLCKLNPTRAYLKLLMEGFASKCMEDGSNVTHVLTKLKHTHSTLQVTRQTQQTDELHIHS